MGPFIVRRLLAMPVTLFFVALITFVIINLKGNPLQRFAFNPRVKPDDIERMERNLGLDKPVTERFLLYLKSLLQGDLQNSLIDSKKSPCSSVTLCPTPFALRSPRW
jgi:ABC-type dipeptide/oligopeptide/nickel transport system permease component